MLFALTILVVLLAAIGVAFLVKRRIDQDLLESDQPKNLMDTHLRPLFEADEEEMRLLDEAQAEAAGEQDVTDREQVAKERLAKLDEFRHTWATDPNKRGTVKLLAMASECENAAVFSGVASDVVHEWRSGRVDGVSPVDLAELIENHFWLLPATERMSGEGFLIKQEISDLRKV